MKKIYQDRFSENGDQGNCMSACIASILDIPLSKVPYFIGEEDFWYSVVNFLSSKGYEYYGFISVSAERKIYWPGDGIDGYFIVAGPSPRDPSMLHAVMYKDGRMVHDPHPSGDGILFIREIDLIRKII